MNADSIRNTASTAGASQASPADADGAASADGAADADAVADHDPDQVDGVANGHGDSSVAGALGIGVIAREIGLTKDTLRVWERRYGFPQPLRAHGGERVYPAEQIERLKIVKRLLDGGHRPGKIMRLPLEALQQLAGSATPRAGVLPDDVLDALVDLLAAGQVGEVRKALAQRLLAFGLGRFVLETAAPLSTRVGDAWASGKIQVYQEHLFSEVLQHLLRGAMNLMPDARQDADARPRVLLTTVPGEQHGLGLLMAEAMLMLSGASCIALGTQTPLLEICAAAQAQRADVVALSYSEVMGMQDVWTGLGELRDRLPTGTHIWVGGSSAALARRTLSGIEHVPALGRVDEAVIGWRKRQVAAS
ncbi:MerR family transcriptional regulator [Pararobbsia alpina]|uniref:MerR family transcriptional regulator n=1 Tax=Pararobbsia alpina TaxID=621374 RepID=UPI0039A73560